MKGLTGGFIENKIDIGTVIDRLDIQASEKFSESMIKSEMTKQVCQSCDIWSCRIMPIACRNRGTNAEDYKQ